MVPGSTQQDTKIYEASAEVFLSCSQSSEQVVARGRHLSGAWHVRVEKGFAEVLTAQVNRFIFVGGLAPKDLQNAALGSRASWREGWDMTRETGL